MARRILNRKELREDYDAAERRKEDTEEGEETEEEEEEEEGEEEAAEGEAAEGEAAEEEADEEAPAPPPKKKAAAKKKKEPAAPKPKRTRAAKITRMRLVWGVFSNSHQCVATYEYPRRKEADEHAARLTNDKRSTHFVQPVKEPMEEKKEKEEKGKEK